MPRRPFWVMTLMLGGLAGCGQGAKSPEPVRVAAASDLQEALPILVSRFKADTGIDVEPTFGSSGQLAQQLRGGAPFDLFLAANRAFVVDLAGDGTIAPGSVRPYTRGSLVLAVNELFDPGVKSMLDLTSGKIKSIAIADPDLAPYGAAAKDALERAGLWEKIRPKLVIAKTVRQAFEYVRSGDAEVGLVGRSVAGAKGVRVISLAPDAYAPIIQGMGVVAASKRPADAEAFARFVLGDVGQAILRDFGFLSLPASD